MVASWTDIYFWLYFHLTTLILVTKIFINHIFLKIKFLSLWFGYWRIFIFRWTIHLLILRIWFIWLDLFNYRLLFLLILYWIFTLWFWILVILPLRNYFFRFLFSASKTWINYHDLVFHEVYWFLTLPIEFWCGVWVVFGNNRFSRRCWLLHYLLLKWHTRLEKDIIQFSLWRQHLHTVHGTKLLVGCRFLNRRLLIWTIYMLFCFLIMWNITATWLDTIKPLGAYILLNQTTLFLHAVFLTLIFHYERQVI